MYWPDQSQEAPMSAPPEQQPLSAEALSFVESMGVNFERYALPRIGGRLLGLLLVADGPLSLDDLASILRVSRASVSTNVRLILTIGLAELVTRPGDRRDYYRFTPNAWERVMLLDMEGVQAWRKLAERGLEAIESSAITAREHLDEMIAFCDLMLGTLQATLERWRTLQQAK